MFPRLSRTIATSSRVLANDPNQKKGMMEQAGDALKSAAQAFKSDGAVGKEFQADGSVGGTAQEVGGPFDKDGAVGKHFKDSGSVGGTVEKLATHTKQKGEQVKQENK